LKSLRATSKTLEQVATPRLMEKSHFSFDLRTAKSVAHFKTFAKKDFGTGTNIKLKMGARDGASRAFISWLKVNGADVTDFEVVYDKLKYIHYSLFDSFLPNVTNLVIAAPMNGPRFVNQRRLVWNLHMTPTWDRPKKILENLESLSVPFCLFCQKPFVKWFSKIDCKNLKKVHSVRRSDDSIPHSVRVFYASKLSIRMIRHVNPDQTLSTKTYDCKVGGLTETEAAHQLWPNY